MGPRRELIGLAMVIAGCASRQTVESIDEGPPTMVVAKPPADSPTSSGGSSGSASGPAPGCPSTRGDEAPVTPLSADELGSAAVGIYRSCSTAAGFEIRSDDETGHFRWYFLDERFVRRDIQGMAGSFEITSCEGQTCTLTWLEDGKTVPVSESREVWLWRTPTALMFGQRDPRDLALTPEWVRIAD
jgi:hypothetical protein